MGRSYSMDAVCEAEDLYCIDRLSMREISERTHIPRGTLQRWSTKYDWTMKREKIRRAESDARTDLICLRAKQIRHCLDTVGVKGAAMDIFAAAKLEEVQQKAEELAREQKKAPAYYDAQDINSPAEAAEALTEALVRKVSAVLANPADLDLKLLLDLRKALQIAVAVDEDSSGVERHQPVSEDVAAKLKQALGLLS